MGNAGCCAVGTAGSTTNSVDTSDNNKSSDIKQLDTTTTRCTTNAIGAGDHNTLSNIKQCETTSKISASGNVSGNASIIVNVQSNCDKQDSCCTEDVTISDLKLRLKKWNSDLRVPFPSWMKVADKSLEKYYIPLQLNSIRRVKLNEEDGHTGLRKETQLSSQESTVENVKLPINLIDIFDKVYDDSPKIILIESQPGLGKTTLAHKIVSDWGMDENYAERFDLAILIPLRNVKEKTLREVVLEILEEKDNEKVWNLINSDRTLLVLDGLDEVGDCARENILKVLYDKISNKMTIVVTCRTGLFKLDERDRGLLFLGVAKSECFWDKKIEILGFDDESRRKFLDKFIAHKNKDEILEKITEAIKRMEDVPQSPLILILLVYISHDDEIFTMRTITDLYNKLVNYIIKSSGDKNARMDKSVALRGDDHVNFRNFGKRSLDHILNDNLQFDCDDLTDKIYRMGFLIKHKTLKNGFIDISHYESCHLTFMEYAAAYSLWDKFQSNGNEFTDETLDKINEICFKKRSVSMILPFLCGLMRGDVKKLFQQLYNFRALYSLEEQHLMKSILRECEASDDVCKILAHFIPKVVDGPCYKTLFLRNKILTNNIVLLDVLFNDLQTLAQLGKIQVETIYVGVLSSCPVNSNGTGRSNLSCENLFINVAGCNIDSYYNVYKQLKFLLNDVSCSHKHLIMGTQFDEILIKNYIAIGIFRNHIFDSLSSELTEGRISDDPIITNIIKQNIVKRLEISVKSDLCFKNLYKILEIAGSLSNILTSILIFSASKLESKLDLSSAINNGEKCWSYFRLRNINVECSVSPASSECIESFEITGNYNNDVKALYALKPKKLRCNYALYDRLMLDPNLRSWPGFQSVTNLTLDIRGRHESLETLSHIIRFSSLKKVAFSLLGTEDLSKEQQRNITECLQLLTVDQIQFFCKHVCLVTDVVNGIKDLLGKNELSSIQSIDLELSCGHERGKEAEYTNFLSALENAISNDFRITAHFMRDIGGEPLFLELFKKFFSSQFKIKQITRISPYLKTDQKLSNWYYENVVKIQKKKNISDD